MAQSHPSPPEVSHDDVAFMAAVKEGEAALDGARSVPYAAVRDWLLSWGTKKELPPPECP